ncbi:MAG: hypothetical protein HKN82_07220 [Akkermansiaceae bacterium]|nr:hypothetical protein [Akkermansiaceae bacterium]NNM30378.1 hypothetical protein [Akkermansiaceae bacterium]
MFGGPHPYENIPLSVLGYFVGGYCLLAHGFMLLKPEFCQGWLKKLPRHYNAGVYTLAFGMIWFWLLVAPDAMRGPFAFLGNLSMDIGEFNAVKKWLRIIVPIAYIGMVLYVKEFLFVRGLGVVALMAAGPILDGAFLRIPETLPFTRLLIPLFAYVLLTKGCFWVGMPYTFRDAVTWATASQKRWRMLGIAGLAYGGVVLICSLTIWRGV